MKTITLTSNDFLGHTRLLLASLRRWHPDWPVTVYALEQGWEPRHLQSLAEFRVEVQVWPEPDISLRGSAIGRPKCPLWKLDILRAQQEPFLWLDGDTLVLRPLQQAQRTVADGGWLAIHDELPAAQFHWGELAEVTGLPAPDPALPGFTTAVLGVDPGRYRAVLDRAAQWGGQLRQRMHTDQAVLNLAWLSVQGAAAPAAGWAFCAPLKQRARFTLGAMVVHIAGVTWRSAALTKLEYQQQVFTRYPGELPLTPLTETDFWRQLGPLPWRWGNQRNLPRHRGFVRAARLASRSLLGLGGLIVADDTQAHLLDRATLREGDRFWHQAAPRFKGLRYWPTYHLEEDGRCPAQRRHHLRRLTDDLRALLPR